MCGWLIVCMFACMHVCVYVFDVCMQFMYVCGALYKQHQGLKHMVGMPNNMLIMQYVMIAIYPHIGAHAVYHTSKGLYGDGISTSTNCGGPSNGGTLCGMPHPCNPINRLWSSALRAYHMLLVGPMSILYYVAHIVAGHNAMMAMMMISTNVWCAVHYSLATMLC